MRVVITTRFRTAVCAVVLTCVGFGLVAAKADAKRAVIVKNQSPYSVLVFQDKYYGCAQFKGDEVGTLVASGASFVGKEDYGFFSGKYLRLGVPAFKGWLGLEHPLRRQSVFEQLIGPQFTEIELRAQIEWRAGAPWRDRKKGWEILVTTRELPRSAS